jgi:hypothetical protein
MRKNEIQAELFYSKRRIGISRPDIRLFHWRVMPITGRNECSSSAAPFVLYAAYVFQRFTEVDASVVAGRVSDC